MKKFKKILVLALSLAMVLGMSVTTFAQPKKPTNDDVGSITVTGIKDGTATIKGYKIVKANYNDDGFSGYSKVDELDEIEDIYKPTADEITTLAKKYGDASKTPAFTINSGTAVAGQSGVYSYTQNNLKVGTYLILVTGSNDVVYNPMVVSVSYKTGNDYSGNLNESEDGTLTLPGNWDDWGVAGAVVYAKSSEVSIKKTAESKTVNNGEDVKFKVETKIPDYSAEYNPDTLKFEISDTLSPGLTLITPTTDKPFKVEVKGSTGDYANVDAGSGTYSVIGVADNSTTYTLSFASSWINTNKGSDVRVTYYAKADGTNVNATPFQNDVKLTYTHNTTTGTGGEKETKDKEYVYTFNLIGSSEADAKGFIEKVKTENDEKKPLGGAEFTLYTDPACSMRYYNKNHPEKDASNNPINYTAISDNTDGRINITGLAADTYYLKETKAPDGYSLTDKVFRIVITPEYNQEKGKNTTLKEWTVKVAEVVVNGENVTVASDTTEAFYTFTATPTTDQQSGEVISWSSAAKAGNSGTTQIENIKLSALPSTGGIGTTIFTIGGCAIMILAAGLYFASRRRSAK